MNNFIAWIQSIYKRFYNRFFNSKAIVEEEKSKPLNTKNLRAEVESLLNDIQPENYSRYVPGDGLWKDIEVPWDNIEIYIRKVRYASHLVEKQKEIPKDWYPESITELSIDRFLLTSEGKYLDRVSTIDDFKNAGLSLCKGLAPCDTDQFGPLSHYYRTLLRLLLNLKTLAKALNLQK